jgi:hypothetical protein
MDKKVVMLKNLYTGEVVYTESYNKVDKVNSVEFIMVYNINNPERKYLVNRNAYVIVNK